MSSTLLVTSGSPEFDALRDFLRDDAAVRNEMENAFLSLTEAINVSDRASRFVAGATGEWIISCACYAAGIIAIPEGHNADGFDLAGIQAATKGLFSVKCSFSPTSTFRITNGINGAGKGFVEPTIFAHARLGGLVFADPSRHHELASHAQTKADAVVLGIKAIRSHAEQHPECVIEMTIPTNKGRGTYDPSTEFARQLIAESRHYPNLARVFEDVSRSGAPTTVLDQIRELQAMRDSGLLTQDQLRRAIDSVV